MAGLDWLYPPVCGGCGRLGFRWCPVCQNHVKPIPDPFCDICGLPQNESGICLTCRKSQPPYKVLRSWLIFEGPIRNALHQLKYQNNLALGEALAKPISEFMRGLCWPIDMVVPVPLGKQRLQERGYNQIGLVARPLAALNDLRYSPLALTRVLETESQVGLSVAKRLKNVRGAFRGNAQMVEGRTVLLMDDIATTGATLTACAEALLQNGAQAVFALTLARALPLHDLQVV